MEIPYSMMMHLFPNFPNFTQNYAECLNLKLTFPKLNLRVYLK